MSGTQRDKYAPSLSKGPVNRLGSGLVALGVPKRAKSSAKLAVPKPVNLPSLKKENAGNDPTTQLVPTGQSGWTTKAEEQDHSSAASIVERSTWASGEPPRLQHPPQAAWQRAGALNPTDFPSLAASTTAKQLQQPSRAPPDVPGQAGNWDEDEREYRSGPTQRSALIDRAETSGRDVGQPRSEHPGYSGSGYRESERGAYGRDARHPPGDSALYERGHYREQAYATGRDGGYVRDRPEQSQQEWEEGYGREGPYAEEGRGGYAREHFPPRYDRLAAPPYSGQRGMRHENGSRGGYESHRRYDDGYREEHSRDSAPVDDGYNSRRPHPRYERPPLPYPPLATDYDPDLFPPMPSAGAALEGVSGRATGELDQEREAFNAELERVAAELDKKRQAAQAQADGSEGPTACEHPEWTESGREEGEESQANTYVARAAARHAAEDEERSRREAAARKLREIEERMAQREEAAQRKARELADAQAAAHAALCKPPPPGAEPAFERRPAPALERRAEPRFQTPIPTVVPPPPPPPPRPAMPSEPPSASPSAPAAALAEPQADVAAAQAAAPAPPSPPHHPAASQATTAERPPAPAPSPVQPGPTTHLESPARSPRASSRPPPPPQQQQQQPAVPSPAAIVTAPARPPPPPQSSLVKPGASWRSILSGVPDSSLPQLTGASDQHPAAQRAPAAAGKGAARESKRGKGRTGRVAAAPTPTAAAQPPSSPSAPDGGAPSKCKGRGKGSKGQKALAAGSAPSPAPDSAAPASDQQAAAAPAQRGGRRQQQVQREAAAGAGGAVPRSGRSGGATKSRARSKGGQAQPQLSDPATAPPEAAAAVEEQVLPQAGIDAAAPMAPPLAGEQVDAVAVPHVSRGGVVLVDAPAPSTTPLSSAAAFGWSSPLADEMAKLQLSAAASADAGLAAEVEAAVAGTGGMGIERELAAPMATLLDQDLLEPSPLHPQTLDARLDPVAPPAAGREAAAGQGGGGAPLADLLGDDDAISAALPADLTLDLAGGGAPQRAASATVLQPHAASAGFALPPQQHEMSPPPFPGGLFPIPSMAVGGSNPWQHSPTLQESSAAPPSLVAAAHSLYSLAQQPHFTFGTHTNIPIPGAPPAALPTSHFGQQHLAAAAFLQQGPSAPYGQHPSSFLPPPSAAFIPTGRQPDWSTPHGRTSSPAPLPSYSPVPPQSLPQPQNPDAVLSYSRAPTTGMYGRTLPAHMPLAPMQYAHQQQQRQPSPPRHPHGFAQQHQPYDPAAALPDDVFGEGPSGGSSSIAAVTVLMGGGMARRGSRQEAAPASRARPRYDGGMGNMHPQQMGPSAQQQQQQQHMFLMMNGFQGRGPAGYGSRGSVVPPGVPRQQHMMGSGGMGLRGPGPAVPPPPPEGGSSNRGGGRARQGRAGRSGRGTSGGAPQPMKNMYVPRQQQQQGGVIGAAHKPGAEEAVV